MEIKNKEIFNEYLKLLYGGNKGFVKIMCGKKGVEKPRMSLYKVNLVKVGEPLSIDDITEKILTDKPEWYDGFENPLPEKRTIVLTKPSNPAIKYRDKTLREMLDSEDYPVFKGTGRADEEKRASAKKYYRSRNPVPKKEKIKKASKKAKKLKDNGDTYDEIALKLHISRSTAINYVKKAA